MGWSLDENVLSLLLITGQLYACYILIKNIFERLFLCECVIFDLFLRFPCFLTILYQACLSDTRKSKLFLKSRLLEIGALVTLQGGGKK